MDVNGSELWPMLVNGKFLSMNIYDLSTNVGRTLPLTSHLGICLMMMMMMMMMVVVVVVD